MKYTGRITFLIFIIMVSFIESFSEKTNLLTILEAIFFGLIAFFAGSLFDKSVYYRKQAETSQEQYRNLVEFSPDPILVYQDNKIVYINDKSEQLLQLRTEEIIGKPIFDFILPDFHSIIKERIQKLSSGDKEVVRMELKIRGHQNKILDIETTSVTIDYNNKPAVEVFLRDVTSRKKLEEESRKKEDRYRFITENTTDMITFINPQGVYEYISPSCVQLVGYDQKELLDKNIFDFFHPDEMEAISQFFYEAKSNLDFASFPHRYKKKDGSYLWLETNARTIRSDKKVLEGIVSVSRDITERVEKEKSLLESNEILRYLSNYDGLTDIPNRRYFEQKLQEVWQGTMSHSMPLSILMVDIDNFKKFNDHYGHQEGDRCVKEIAKAIKETLKRPGDFVARYGGEEFIILLPNTESIGAAFIGESLLQNVKNLKLETEASEVSNYVTISIGCATAVPTDQQKPEELIKLADEALYSAKEAGKNRVKVGTTI